MSVRIPGRSHNPGVITCGFDVRLDTSRPLRRENAIMKRLTIALLLFVSALALPSFTQEKTSKGADLLRTLEADFAKAVAEHGHDAFVSYFAEDGVELEDGGGIKTKDDMRKESAWPPDFSLNWAPVKAEMAASGELGYAYGNYELKSRDKDGKFVTRYGKYASIWKKQKDGSWKVVLDMGNSSPAPKPE
jgi:ketosteroid isomerase-like protein